MNFISKLVIWKWVNCLQNGCLELNARIFTTVTNKSQLPPPLHSLKDGFCGGLFLYIDSFCSKVSNLSFQFLDCNLVPKLLIKKFGKIRCSSCLRKAGFTMRNSLQTEKNFSEYSEIKLCGKWSLKLTWVVQKHKTNSGIRFF